MYTARRVPTRISGRKRRENQTDISKKANPDGETDRTRRKKKDEDPIMDANL